MPDDQDADIVLEELESLAAIFPESEIDMTSKSGSISLQVKLSQPLSVSTSDNSHHIKVTDLPPITLCFKIPVDYPYDSPPDITLSTSEHWLTSDHLKEIKEELINLWNQFHDAVLYSMIDYLITESPSLFGILDSTDSLKVSDPELIRTLDSFNKRQQREVFDSQFFTCEICQMEVSGNKITKFEECEHYFCGQCLDDYFTLVITRGEVDNVHCPSYTCTKAFIKSNEEKNSIAESYASNLHSQDFEKFEKDFFKLPISIELLQICLTDKSLVDRYRTLFNKQQFSRYRNFLPGRVAECPREHCLTMFLRDHDKENLAICPDCNFAFCVGCLHSWHGNLNSCRSIAFSQIPIEDLDLWLESEPESQARKNLGFKYGRHRIELAANDYLADNMFEEMLLSGDSDITRCPCCETPIQRSDGCNKMTCSKCRAFFCNLCGNTLSKEDPYKHFNDVFNPCYGKLFEGMISEE